MNANIFVAQIDRGFTMDKNRQEVVNVILAQLLQERGIVSAPERIINLGTKIGRRMPDVLVNYSGLRMAIEGEYGHRKKAKELAMNSARRRVTDGIAHIGVALVYDPELRDTDFNKLKNCLEKSKMEMAIVTEAGETNFVQGDVNYLKMTLQNAFEQLVAEDVVEEAVALLDGGIEKFASVIMTNASSINRIAECLGIRELEIEDKNGDNAS